MPTASSWLPVRGPGHGPARSASPVCTCCAPSMTRWRLRAELRPGARLVVIGAGFIGAEVASTATKLGLDVTVVEAAPAPLAGPLGVAARRRSGAAARRARHPAVVRGRRCRALPAATGSPACSWPTGVRCPPTSSWSASARCPTSSGCATARSNWPTVWCVTRVGQRRSRTWLRSATARPGMRPCVGRPHRVEHWTGALERPAIAVATLLAGGRHHGTPARPPYFWSDQYGCRIQFAGIAGPATRSPSRSAACTMPASWPSTAAADQPVAVLGVNQPRLFTRWRRQLTAPSRRQPDPKYRSHIYPALPAEETQR